MKKKYIVLLILVALFAGFYYFTPTIESIVKKIVNKYGSEITGTEVSLDGFKLALTNGEGRISKITVANPKEYSTPYVFSLEEIGVKVNIKSLTTDTVIIDSIEINKPVITYEMLSLTRNNISEIQKNVQKNTAKTVKKEEKVEKAPKNKSGADTGKNIIIKDLIVKDGEIQAVALKGKGLNVKLPTIHMKNIGEQKKGASVAETISKVLNQILSTASQTIVKSNISDLKGVAEENLDKVVGGVKERVKSIGIFGK